MFKKNFIWILALICCFVSCTQDEPTPTPPVEEKVEPAPLTILAYLVANNNLDNDLYVNIAAMCQGISLMDKPATLFVYWDGKSSVGTSATTTHAILKFETDGKGNVNGKPSMIESTDLNAIMAIAEVVKEYPAQISTSERVMTNVLKDMVALSKTNRFGLIFGSHGSAWTNSIFTSRSFGQDGSGTDNTILLPEMVSALKSTGKKFDFLLFDACYMGTAEVCYDFKDVVDYQLVSVMEVPAYGFPYNTDLLVNLFEGTVDGYTKACQEFVDYYEEVYEDGEQAWATIALVDSKEVNNLTQQIKNQITQHKETLADFDVSSLQEYGQSTAPNIASDLRQFVEELNGGEVPSEFDAQLNKTVLFKDCMEIARPSDYGVDAENFSGLGIYIPVSSRKKWNTYFQTIDWYTASGWNEVTFSWNF